MYVPKLAFVRHTLAVTFCMALMSAVPAFASSTSIYYPDVVTGNYRYSSIFESSATDAVPLYGTPTGIAGSLQFGSTMTFGASAGSGGVDITDGHLFFQIEHTDHSPLDFLTINEGGSYSIGAGGTSATQVKFELLGLTLNITGIDGALVDGPTVTGTMHHIPSSPITTPGTGTWTGTSSFDLDTILANTGHAGHHVTQATLTFDNNLVAQSELGTSASIYKTQVTITPEPGTFVLLGIAALGLGGYAWHRLRRIA